MYSDIYKFIFLHPGKCGGSSVKTCLWSLKLNPRLGNGHSTLNEQRDHIINRGLNPDEYHVFTMVRNPYDRMVSWYTHASQGSDANKTHKKYAGTFLEFLKERLDVNKPSENLIPPYSSCDTVLRYESLQSDFDVLLSKLNLPSVTLPRLNQTNRSTHSRQHFMDMYDTEARNIVHEYFHHVITEFNYD